ncbi:MAG: thioredoxin domain-containing protein [Chitinophagaceae bacterium]
MSQLKPGVQDGDHTKGPDDASITLVEYGDYECPHCGIAHPLIQRLLKEFDGDIRFVFRNFPLRESHPHAFMAALAAEAADKQNKFWEMHDIIYEHQRGLSENSLKDFAKKLDLDLAAFDRDWQGNAVVEKVENDFDSGVRSGVNGTPGFFLNGKPLKGYDETYDSLREAVQAVIA